MSRFNRFAHSLASGYAALGANVVYSLSSVPLALHYLERAQFGLWATVSQIAGYIALIDLGMSGVSRLLIDHKDDKRTGRYGGFVKTTLLVSAVQGVIILMAGYGVGVGLAAVMGVPAEFAGKFRWLILGQSGILMAGFMARVLQYMLAAHQRYDVTNYGSVAAFGASLGASWLGFSAGCGVYSLLWGNLAGFVVQLTVGIAACHRLRLFPPPDAWGRTSWADFKEMFIYGLDIFLFMLGGQLISASQTILVARTLGLEAAAVWAACSRSFSLIQQVTYRVFDSSVSALAEMLVRGERDRLLRRFRSIVTLSCSGATVAAVLFAACNQVFVEVWLPGRRMGWDPLNDLLLAIWLLLCVQVRSHTGLVGQAKAFGALRYVFFLEGVLFVGLALGFLRWGGITAMLSLSIVATLLVSYPYGIWRTALFFGLSWREVALVWVAPAVRTLVVLGPLGWLGWRWVRDWPPLLALAFLSVGLGGIGAVVLLRWGLEAEFQRELTSRCPRWLRTYLGWIGLPAMGPAGMTGTAK